ncbi:hypothetical protein LCGC14_1713470 [marine sediment metagenome]|uniref:Uncharacterized protein n=1 Tax=marine sediment metagenome TaxID=412755 RepID=A0A0F9JV02_9ZZZZ
MPKGRGYLAHGASGLKGREKMKKDVVALTDKAKREKEFEKSVGDNIKRVKAGKKPRATPSRAAKELVKKVMSRVRSPAAKARHLRVKAGEMNAAANKVVKSGTGNVKAEATYRRLAKGYMSRAAALLKKGK